MPGHEKIVSVRMAPASRCPTCSRITVSTGSRAYRTARLTLTARRDTDRNAQHDGHDDGRDRQLDGRRKAPQQIGGDRIAADDRHAEIAVEYLAHIQDVLLPDRAIEPEAGAHLRHLLGRRPLAEHC